MDFEIIYRKYFKDVLLYVCGLTGDALLAEEITQETFMKALKAIDSYNGEKDIRAWLFTIAKNAYFSYCRKQKCNVPFPEDDMLQDTGVSFIEALEDSEDAIRIHTFIHRMDEPYKEVFILRVMGELSYDKIGAVFGKSSGWARVTFYRAKQKIAEFMEDSYE